MRKLGVIIALESEARAILDNPAYRWRALPGGRYESGGYPLSLMLSGVGKVYAAWAYARLAPETDAVVSMGTSGGLSDEEVGSAFRVSEFAEHDMCVESMGCEPGLTPYGPLKEAVMASSDAGLDGLIDRACREAGVKAKPGRAIAGDEFLTDPARAASKRDFFKAHIVDMESAGMAKLALSRSGKPFAALRIVSDNANHDSGADWAASLDMAARRFDAVLLRLGSLVAEGK